MLTITFPARLAIFFRICSISSEASSTATSAANAMTGVHLQVVAKERMAVIAMRLKTVDVARRIRIVLAFYADNVFRVIPDAQLIWAYVMELFFARQGFSGLQGPSEPVRQNLFLTDIPVSIRSFGTCPQPACFSAINSRPKTYDRVNRETFVRALFRAKMLPLFLGGANVKRFLARAAGYETSILSHSYSIAMLET